MILCHRTMHSKWIHFTLENTISVMPRLRLSTYANLFPFCIIGCYKQILHQKFSKCLPCKTKLFKQCYMNVIRKKSDMLPFNNKQTIRKYDVFFSLIVFQYVFKVTCIKWLKTIFSWQKSYLVELYSIIVI